MSSIKKEIQRLFSRTYGLTLKASAATWLEELCQAQGIDDHEVAHSQIDALAKAVQLADDCPSFIDVEILDRTWQKLRMTEDQEDNPVLDEDGLDATKFFNIIDPFDMPRYHFNADKKAFEKSATKPSIAGTSDSKAMYLRDRYNIIKQIVLRNEHFSPPALPGHDRQNYMTLTSVKNLLGRQGQRFMLFGLLARMEDGSYYLEDLDDKVQLDLTDATPASGLFTEGAMVLVEGDYTEDSIFKVWEIGHPPSERRGETRSIFGHMDFLGVGAMSLADERKLQKIAEAKEDGFVVMSDFWLDHPGVLSSFRTILEAYESRNAPMPALFILCGNFCSTPFLFNGAMTTKYQQLFGSLGELLSQFPLVLSESHFILIPGPTDPWDCSTLPRPPLAAPITKPLTSRIQNVTFASNPCRIRYLSQEIVIFREDLMSKMLRNSIKFTEKDTASLKEHLVQTILDQAHLSPLALSVRPVIWEYDHALRLYPMPTALVLADKYPRYSVTYEETCHVFNPGRFVGDRFNWAMYLPNTNTSEECDL